MESSREDNFIYQLREMLSKFPRGLNLNAHDLASVGWLYFYEKQTGQRDIAERELCLQLERAVSILGLEGAVSARAGLDRLLQYRLLRQSISEVSSHRYCLTRLARSLAEDILAEINLESDELSTHINHIFASLKAGLEKGDEEELIRFVRHVFLEAMRDKLEYKLQSIEEGILDQEKRVKELGSGGDQEAFDQEIGLIKQSRRYLDELLETLQSGSTYYPLYDLLYRCQQEYSHNPSFQNDLEYSLDFLDGLRKRIEQMLAHLVGFIHDCLSYQALIGTLSYRDRLCYLQKRILNLALQEDIRLPVFEQPTLTTINLNWSSREQKRPVVVNLDKLKALEDYVPEPLRQESFPGKEEFLELAREEWQAEAGRGLELGPWLLHLINSRARGNIDALQALWVLLQNLPGWQPEPELTRAENQDWTDLGRFCLEPVILRSEVRGQGK